MVTIRSPFCGYNTIWCVELNGEDLSCYSNKTEWASLRKCSYNHWLTDKAYLSVFITVTNIYQSFTYKMAAKINWHRWSKIKSVSPYVFLCLSPSISPKLHAQNLRQIFIFYTCYLYATVALFGRPVAPLRYVIYFRFYWWRHITYADNGPC